MISIKSSEGFAVGAASRLIPAMRRRDSLGLTRRRSLHRAIASPNAMSPKVNRALTGLLASAFNLSNYPTGNSACQGQRNSAFALHR
jgi:hypothetical protein